MTATTLSPSARPDYGIDAPGVIRNFILLGIALAIIGRFIPSYSVLGGRFDLGGTVSGLFVGSSGWWIATGLLMIVYARIGKFRHRDRMLGMVSWRGDETVLDVGTGRGLLMIGAAKRLERGGKSCGIDIWNAEDLSGNSAGATLRNAELEGVSSRIELRSEDVRKMSFPDASFDVILSNLCVHNLYQPEQRAAACREIARVLKPGGVALISDFRHTKDYAEELRRAGLEAELRGPYWLTSFPPLTIVYARRSAN